MGPPCHDLLPEPPIHLVPPASGISKVPHQPFGPHLVPQLLPEDSHHLHPIIAQPPGLSPWQQQPILASSSPLNCCAVCICSHILPLMLIHHPPHCPLVLVSPPPMHLHIPFHP